MMILLKVGRLRQFMASSLDLLRAFSELNSQPTKHPDIDPAAALVDQVTTSKRKRSVNGAVAALAG